MKKIGAKSKYEKYPGRQTKRTPAPIPPIKSKIPDFRSRNAPSSSRPTPRSPDRILLCDRGTVDGAAYWPGAPGDFFDALGTTLEHELARYDGVIFFESAATGGLQVEGGNPVRNESIKQAAKLDARLRKLWTHHSRFVVVRHDDSFFKKIGFGLAELNTMVADLAVRPRESQPLRRKN